MRLDMTSFGLSIAVQLTSFMTPNITLDEPAYLAALEISCQAKTLITDEIDGHLHLPPHTSKLIIRNRPIRLTYNLIIPASIVVDVDDTISPCVQTSLNQLVIDAEIVRV
jgi:hypothetical protein